MRLKNLPLAAALVLATAAAAHAVTLTIYSDVQDRQLSENGGMTWYGNKTMRAGDGGIDNSIVYLFALPELEPDDLISDAAFSLGLLNSANSPDFNIDLYGVGYRSTAEVLATDFYEGLFDEDPNAVGLQQHFITPATPVDSIAVTDATGAANLTAFLGDLYTAGAVAGDFAVIRLSNDTTNAGNYNYYGVPAGNHDNLAVRPTLNITTVPEPSTTAALFGVVAFGLVVLRRRLRS